MRPYLWGPTTAPWIPGCAAPHGRCPLRPVRAACLSCPIAVVAPGPARPSCRGPAGPGSTPPARARRSGTARRGTPRSGRPPGAAVDRADPVAPPGVGEPDRELGQPAPQLPLARRGGLPRRLEYLVGLERPTLVEQALGVGERLSGERGEVVRDRRRHRQHRGATAGPTRRGGWELRPDRPSRSRAPIPVRLSSRQPTGTRGCRFRRAGPWWRLASTVTTGDRVSRAQYAFAVGFAVAALWAVAGFPHHGVAAVAAGLVGLGVVRLLDGRVDVSGWVERLSAGRR